MEMKEGKWYIVGYLAGGESVYCSAAGGLAKEMDHEFLVGMTEKELRQVLPERRKNYERI